MRKSSLLIIGCLFLLVGCKHDRLDVDVSSIEVEFELNRFEELVFQPDTDQLKTDMEHLNQLYPEFIDLYTQDIISVGEFSDNNFWTNFERFYSDSVIARVADSVLYVFSDIKQLESEISEGYKHLRYYFPTQPLPNIFTMVSGFNQSLVIAESFIGINLDKYLGANCIFYEYLGIPKYKRDKMYPAKIVPDLFYAYAITEFPKIDQHDHLLSNMIYQGKLMYFTEAMCPDVPDSTLMGYSNQNMEWMQHNEGTIWAYWAEKNFLYSSERLDLQKFIGDAPFTSNFGNDSPGRTGVYVGWQIVRSFMNNNEEVTLNELMAWENSQEILALSGYYPE